MIKAARVFKELLHYLVSVTEEQEEEGGELDQYTSSRRRMKR